MSAADSCPAARGDAPTRLAACAGLAALALLAVSCAPTARRVAPLDGAATAARYERARLPRAARLAAVRLEATLWIEGERIGKWPAFQLDLALVAPAAMRARVASLFGTALDLLVRDDSLRAWVPPRRIAVEVEALEDSLGVHAPARWACRAFAADWDARTARWSADEFGWRAEWAEGTDSLSMRLDADGRPAEVALRDGAGRGRVIRYPGWQVIDGVAWPARVEFVEREGEWRAHCRVDRVRFAPEADPRWLSLEIPTRAERLDWPALREALQNLGGRE